MRAVQSSPERWPTILATATSGSPAARTRRSDSRGIDIPTSTSGQTGTNSTNGPSASTRNASRLCWPSKRTSRPMRQAETPMRMGAVMPGAKPSADSAGDGPVIVWFRLDLRLADNPALAAAVTTARRAGIIPVFNWAPDEEAPFAPGAASRVWLHDSLTALAAALAERGSRLVLRVGPSLETLLDIAKQTGARGVFWNRRYEPAVAARDARVDAALRARGLATATSLGLPSANLLWEPEALTTRAGQPFRMFTPFWRACREQPPPLPAPAPRELPPPRRWPASVPLAALGLRPKIGWDAGLRAAWSPGEASARARLKEFV